MKSKADIIARLIDQAAPRVAVVFSGDVPRLLGTLGEAPSAEAVKRPVDAMMASQRLSAQHISLGKCHGRLFVAAHG